MTSTGQSFVASTTSLLRSHVKLLFDHLPGAVAGNEEAVHELRIAARRLRVALLALAARPAAKRQARCRAMLRRLVRASGLTRDLDVAAGLLDAHLAIGNRRVARAAVLRRHLRAAQRRSRARLAQTLLDADIGRLRADLERLVAHGAIETPTALSRCAELIRARRTRVVASLAALGLAADPEALHAIRRGVRRLRYLLDLRRDLGAPPDEAAHLLKGLQDALGHIHDEYVLATWLAAHAQRAEARGADDQRLACSRLAARAEQARRRLHKTYLNRRPLVIVSRAMDLSGVSGNGPRRVRAAG